jgi:hypothetical protein
LAKRKNDFNFKVVANILAMDEFKAKSLKLPVLVSWSRGSPVGRAILGGGVKDYTDTKNRQEKMTPKSNTEV